MISGTSLQAFSGASTTQPLDRASATNPVRLARSNPNTAPRQAAGTAASIPDVKPALPLPRGSLLNLSV